jgi:hypothetical protein
VGWSAAARSIGQRGPALEPLAQTAAAMDPKPVSAEVESDRPSLRELD